MQAMQHNLLANKYILQLKLIFITFLIFIYTHATAATKPIVPIQHWKTSNGVPVYFVAAHELPIIDLKIMFTAGSAYDGKQPGLAALTNGMLNEGTTTKTVEQIAEAFDEQGAIFYNNISRDAATLQLRSLANPKQFSPALTTFIDVLTHPSFPIKNFTRLQQQTLSLIKQQQQSPQYLAYTAFYTKIYGNYPYAHPSLGTDNSIKAIQVTDLTNFYQKYYVSNNATLAIVGDLNKQQAKKLAEQIVNKLPKGQAASQLIAPSYHPHNKQQHIEFPTSQTSIRIGELGITKQDSRYFPLIVGNYILGGGMTSRLFSAIRNQHGFTYGVYSFFAPMQTQGPFLITMETRNAVTTKAIKAAKDILTKFLQQPVSDQELTSAKQYLIGNFKLSLNSNNAILNNIANIGFYQLPLNYLDNYISNIEKVTKQQISQAFAQVINPERLITITVGPKTNQQNAKTTN